MGLGSKLIGRLFGGQLRQPRGFVGRFTGRAMARGNQESNQWTLSLLEIQPYDHVLEVGFGPGQSIRSAAERASHGFVTRVHHSETMVRDAGKLNSPPIQSGPVQLKRADIA